MFRNQLARRRVGAGAAAAAALLVLAGCSTSPAETGATGSAGDDSAGFAAAEAQYEELLSNPALEIEALPEAPPTGLSVAFVNCTLPACLPDGGDEPGAALGWTVQNFPYDLAKGPSDVVTALDSAIASEPDVLIVAQNNGSALVQDQVDAAVEAGIKVINIGGDDSAPGYSACIQCGPALLAQGEAFGNVALADAGEPTSIGVATDKNISVFAESLKGIQDVVAENGGGSTVKELELNVADNPAANAARTVSFLQRNPDVKSLIFLSPALLPGTSSALAAAGLQVKKIAVNPSNDGDVALISSGDVDLWVGGESGDKAYVWRAFDAAVRAVQDAPIDPKAPVPSMRIITKDDPDPSLQAPADFKDVYTTAWGVNK